MAANFKNLTSYLRSLVSLPGAPESHPLPPGDLINIDIEERSDRKILLKLNAEHGPIFKAWSEDRLMICIVGHALGRRILREHASALLPFTLELRELFPIGFMRQMEGETHRTYRDALIHGLNGLDADDYLEDLETICADVLKNYCRGPSGRKGSARAYNAALSEIAASMLLHVIIGAKPGSARLNLFLDLFNRLGPHGIVWKIKEKQIEVFAEIRDELRRLEGSHEQAFSSSLYGQLCARGPVDDTLLGNLIYMVEMGRYDMRGLFRWISKYAAENPDWVERIARAEKDNPEQAQRLARAFILETLRMDQSERLMRHVKQDITFDGYKIPEGAMVRICMWEAHKDGDAFPNPFMFEPERFLSPESRADGFSPFGLDHHHCPFSNISIEFGMVFVRALARDYAIEARGDGPAVRGVFHWETARGFSVELHPRDTARPAITLASSPGI